MQLDKNAKLVGRNVGRGNPTQETPRVSSNEAWKAQGLCTLLCDPSVPEDVREDPDLWFVSEYDTEAVDRAISICEQCPVAIKCLRYAVTDPKQHDGIWGGTTPSMRTRRGKRAVRALQLKLGENPDHV